MARPLRIEFPGALYHITVRGNNKKNIYIDDSDRWNWMSVFAEVAERYNWACYSYCLMNNHYHLLVQTAEGNLSQGMRQLNGVYTQRFNRSHGRVGHLFQGRYKAILVQRDAYFLELCRYIVLNPVRAGIVPSAEEWPWSSYQYIIRQQQSPAWFHCNKLLLKFASDRGEAVSEYVDFVSRGVGLPSVWDRLRNQIYLGDRNFIEAMQHQMPEKSDVGEVPALQRRPAPQSISLYAQHAASRDHAIYKAYSSGGYTQRELAEFFGLHYSTVSRVVRKQESATRKT